MIPCANPKAQYLAYKNEIDGAIRRVLESGTYILGNEVGAFEEEFATWQGVKHCIGVGNGTDALVLALRGLGVGPGDEVITVSHTAVATVAAIQFAGATPVFVDIAPSTFTMNTEALEASITSRTKAVIPVHLYGHPADMPAIMDIADRHGFEVIEDCAQAHGAKIDGRKVGNFGKAAAFSFYPTKNLGALGDGGAVTTNNSALAERMMQLRQYGWKERFISEIAGWNSRLDELQAAVLRVRLAGLDKDNIRRRSIAHRYNNALVNLGFVLPETRNNIEHVYHLYVVRTTKRDTVLKKLRDLGVGAAIHYPQAVHQQPAYLWMKDSLPETDRAVMEVLTLPLYPEMSGQDVETVLEALRSIILSGKNQ